MGLVAGVGFSSLCRAEPKPIPQPSVSTDSPPPGETSGRVLGRSVLDQAMLLIREGGILLGAGEEMSRYSGREVFESTRPAPLAKQEEGEGYEPSAVQITPLGAKGDESTLSFDSDGIPGLRRQGRDQLRLTSGDYALSPKGDREESEPGWPCPAPRGIGYDATQRFLSPSDKGDLACRVSPGTRDSVSMPNGLTNEQVRWIIHAHLGEMRSCAEKNLPGETEARVVVRFVVGLSGAVKSQEATEPAPAKLERCILDNVSKWKFPNFGQGEEVAITYPFVFKRSASQP